MWKLKGERVERGGGSTCVRKLCVDGLVGVTGLAEEIVLHTG